MSFSDIFKKSFLSGYADAKLDTTTILISLFITAVIGLYIFFIYRIMTKKTFYVKSFNISLVALAMITSAIILTIQTNIVLSLGMVGALSIVRFRTAIKDPMDLVFLFWSISVGIICGAGLSAIAVITSLVMTIIILLLNKMPEKKSDVILVVNCNSNNIENIVVDEMKKYCKNYTIKSRNLTSNSLDLIVEVKVINENENELVKAIMDIDGVNSSSLLTHDGDITA